MNPAQTDYDGLDEYILRQMLDMRNGYTIWKTIQVSCGHKPDSEIAFYTKKNTGAGCCRPSSSVPSSCSSTCCCCCWPWLKSSGTLLHYCSTYAAGSMKTTVPATSSPSPPSSSTLAWCLLTWWESKQHMGQTCTHFLCHRFPFSTSAHFRGGEEIYTYNWTLLGEAWVKVSCCWHDAHLRCLCFQAPIGIDSKNRLKSEC